METTTLTPQPAPLAEADAAPAEVWAVNTYRVNFVGRNAPRLANDGGSTPLIQNMTWQELLNEKMYARATFISHRFHAGYNELTVREIVPPADAAPE